MIGHRTRPAVLRDLDWRNPSYHQMFRSPRAKYLYAQAAHKSSFGSQRIGLYPRIPGYTVVASRFCSKMPFKNINATNSLPDWHNDLEYNDLVSTSCRSSYSMWDENIQVLWISRCRDQRPWISDPHRRRRATPRYPNCPLKNND